MIAQVKRDKAMAGLLVAMSDLYAFMAKAGGLQQIDDNRKKLLKGMLLQTTECAYFIRDKSQAESFCEYITGWFTTALRP